jgi:bifunctional UDP-N-acetylglucosamine pyrophosphorylase / glucosamine-1-phosphate N-acetyltransferase
VTREPLQAVILAAGKGTRLKSPRAKVLHEAHGLPLLEHVLRIAATVGAEPVTVVVGHQAAEVERAFPGRGVFVRQEPQLGTGHAVQMARPEVARHPERPLLVLSGDVPLLRVETVKGLVDGHRAAGAAATLLTARLETPGAYGRVIRDGAKFVTRIVEARDAAPAELAVDEVNVGVYVFEVAPLLAVLDDLNAHNAQGEYYLTDVVGLLASSGRRVAAVVAEDPLEGRGVNTLAELAEVGATLRHRQALSMMASGVVIEDPSTTSVGMDVQIDPGAVVRPYSLLEGRTRIAAGATVGPFAHLVDAEVGASAHVLDHCYLHECTVGAGASVGPFTHVRPESVIGDNARVGNFVELKKTHLGEGSKAPHLSYLGDATIGPSVNVGAGTITCNYDGQKKHPTRIEAGAFVGSNSTLVAPVTVGAGAYVAAGSAITEDVPAQALALGRARQTIKEGWAAARRARQGGGGSKTHS